MRQAKTSNVIDDGGFTATSWKKTEAKSASISSWTQFYHKPYANDWGKARRKAVERKVELNYGT